MSVLERVREVESARSAVGPAPADLRLARELLNEEAAPRGESCSAA